MKYAIIRLNGSLANSDESGSEEISDGDNMNKQNEMESESED